MITDVERDRDADRKNIHPHPHSRPFRQADHRLPEGEAAGGGRNGAGRQWRRDAERDECEGVPGDGEGGRRMSGMTCDVTDCKWNDGNGSCECDGIYISDSETGDPMCMSAEFEEDEG